MATPLPTRGSPAGARAASRRQAASSPRSSWACANCALAAGSDEAALRVSRIRHRLDDFVSVAPRVRRPSKTVARARRDASHRARPLASATIASATDDGATTRASVPPASCPGAFWTPATSLAALDLRRRRARRTSRGLLAEIVPPPPATSSSPVANKALITSRRPKRHAPRPWIDAVRDAGVTNALVVALDAASRAARWTASSPGMVDREPPATLSAARITTASRRARAAERVPRSAPRGVLLSDVDVATMRPARSPRFAPRRSGRPRRRLVRRARRTAGTTAWTTGDGPRARSLRVGTMRIYAMKGGCSTSGATSSEASRSMDKITSRLEREKAWDQAVYARRCSSRRAARDRIGGRPGAVRGREGGPVGGAHGGDDAGDGPRGVRELQDAVREGEARRVPREDDAAMVHELSSDKWERMKARAAAAASGGDKNALSGFPDGSCANAPDCR